MDKYLIPTDFIDSDHTSIQNFVKRVTQGSKTNIEKAVSLYLAVRDDIWYDPYRIDLRKEMIKASLVLKRESGYCVEKAILLAAAGRAAGIPSRLGFAIVKNHLASERYLEILKTDLFVFHGYTDLYIDAKWVKCTPTFNSSLCKKYGVEVLEFDGEKDSLFQEYDPKGNLYMEYIHDYGIFDDLPYDLFVSELKNYYGHLFERHSGSDSQEWQLNV